MGGTQARPRSKNGLCGVSRFSEGHFWAGTVFGRARRRFRRKILRLSLFFMVEYV